MSINTMATKLKIYESCDQGLISVDLKKYLLECINILENDGIDAMYEFMCKHKEFSETNSIIFSEASGYLSENSINFDFIFERTVTKNLPVMNFTVYGDGDTVRGFGYDPYFKIYDGKQFSTSKNKVRISFLRPEYIVHENNIWNLKGTQKKTLINYLTTNISEGKTLWDELIDEGIKELERFKYEKDYPKWIKIIENCRNNMPDYNKLTNVKK